MQCIKWMKFLHLHGVYILVEETDSLCITQIENGNDLRAIQVHSALRANSRGI